MQKLKFFKENPVLWILFGLAFIACLFNYTHLVNYIIACAILAFISAIIIWKTCPWHPQKIIVDTKNPQEVTEEKQIMPSSSSTQIIFIIGPYAAKWFYRSSDEDATRFDKEKVWILASNINELHRRLEHIEGNYPGACIHFFFPVLPDGHETSEIMQAQLAAWGNSFASLHLEHAHNCVMAVYARLSNERPAYDPDLAIWNGEFKTDPYNKITVQEGFEILRSELELNDDGHNNFATQRNAMAQALFDWFEDEKISQAIQQLLNRMPFSLTSIMLADHGNGFTRHGAWSQWLAKRYGILPGLSSHLSMPPLPDFIAPVPDRKVINIVKMPAPVPVLAPAAQSKIYYWLPLVLPLFIAGVVIIATQQYRSHKNADKISAEEMASSVDITPGHIDPSVTRYLLPLFSSSTSKLTATQESNLAKILPELLKVKSGKFLIIGYSDNTGSYEQNLKLSELRAIAVRDWIMSHSNLPLSNFVIRGNGEKNPLVDNTQSKNRAFNRRVEIIPLTTPSK